MAAHPLSDASTNGPNGQLCLAKVYIDHTRLMEVQQFHWSEVTDYTMICPGIKNPTKWLMLPGAYEPDALYHSPTIH